MSLQNTDKLPFKKVKYKKIIHNNNFKIVCQLAKMKNVIYPGIYR